MDDNLQDSYFMVESPRQNEPAAFYYNGVPPEIEEEHFPIPELPNDAFFDNGVPPETEEEHFAIPDEPPTMDDYSEEYVMVEAQQEIQKVTWYYDIPSLSSLLEKDYFGNLKTPKETPTDIAEILKKTVIGESSGTTGIPTENPPATSEGASRENHVGSFSFGMKPARKMKLAIEALAEAEFNPQGSARIDVDDRGFEITVHNPHSHVTGFLWLQPPSLIDFNCQKSVQDKEISLAVFLDRLKAVDDEDTITFDLLEGSTVQLAVKFGRPPSREFKVPLLETTVHCQRMSNTIMYCEAGLLPKHLREMIEACQQQGPQKVIANLKEKIAKYFVSENDKGWTLPSDDRLFFSKGISEEEEYTAEFTCHHKSSLATASLLVADSIACLTILEVPAVHIRLRFPLSEHGYMAYVIKAVSVSRETGTST